MKDLETQQAASLARLHEYDLRRAFDHVARKTEVQFTSAQAADDAFALAKEELLKLEVDDDGKVKAKEVKEIIDTLLGERPYLVTGSVQKKQPADTDADKRSTPLQPKTTAEMVDEKRRQLNYTI